MSGEALVRIPNATVYQVERSNNVVSSIANGDFIIAYAASGDDSGLEAQVGPVGWALGRWVASLRFDDRIYAFQLPPLAAEAAAIAAPVTATASSAGDALGWCYFCVTLRSDTPLELIDVLQAVLASGTAYHDYEHLHRQPEQQPGARAGAAGPAEGVAPERRPQEPVATEAAAVQHASMAAVAARADRIAAGLQRGGQLAAAGVLAAAALAGHALQRSADVVVARMQPVDRQLCISPHAQARLERAKSVAARAAEVSGRAVAGALSVTAQVAEQLAQRIADSDLGRKMSSARVGGASAQDLRKVGIAGVEAVETVYDSLADAARIVLTHMRSTVTCVAAHKYGPEAAQAANAGLQVTQSVVEAGLNMYKLRPTALVRKAVKSTAKNVVLGNNGCCSNNNENQLILQPQGQGEPPGPSSAPAPAGRLPLVATGEATGASTSAGPARAATAPQPHVAALAGPPAAAPYNSGTMGIVVPGVPVAGPVMGQPVLMDYMPSVAAVQGVSTTEPVAVPGTGAGQELLYPAVSDSQYTTRYYPAVPRA